MMPTFRFRDRILRRPVKDTVLAPRSVIVGGESGPGARPLNEGRVTDMRDQCLAADVPFFFKQWGGVFKRQSGRTLEGRIWDAMPAFQQRRTRYLA